jgi:hypothetical protein
MIISEQICLRFGSSADEEANMRSHACLGMVLRAVMVVICLSFTTIAFAASSGQLVAQAPVQPTPQPQAQQPQQPSPVSPEIQELQSKVAAFETKLGSMDKLETKLDSMDKTLERSFSVVNDFTGHLTTITNVILSVIAGFLTVILGLGAFIGYTTIKKSDAEIKAIKQTALIDIEDELTNKRRKTIDDIEKTGNEIKDRIEKEGRLVDNKINDIIQNTATSISDKFDERVKQIMRGYQNDVLHMKIRNEIDLSTQSSGQQDPKKELSAYLDVLRELGNWRDALQVEHDRVKTDIDDLTRRIAMVVRKLDSDTARQYADDLRSQAEMLWSTAYKEQGTTISGIFRQIYQSGSQS